MHSRAFVVGCEGRGRSKSTGDVWVGFRGNLLGVRVRLPGASIIAPVIGPAARQIKLFGIGDFWKVEVASRDSAVGAGHASRPGVESRPPLGSRSGPVLHAAGTGGAVPAGQPRHHDVAVADRARHQAGLGAPGQPSATVAHGGGAMRGGAKPGRAHRRSGSACRHERAVVGVRRHDRAEPANRLRAGGAVVQRAAGGHRRTSCG